MKRLSTKGKSRLVASAKRRAKEKVRRKEVLGKMRRETDFNRLIAKRQRALIYELRRSGLNDFQIQQFLENRNRRDDIHESQDSNSETTYIEDGDEEESPENSEQEEL